MKYLKNIKYLKTNNNIFYLIVVCILVFSSCVKERIAPGLKYSFIQYFEGGGAVGLKVKQTADNGYIIMGTTKSKEGDNNIYLAGIDQFGSGLWIKSIGGLENETGNNLQILSDGSIMIVGYLETKEKDSTKAYVVKIKANSKGEVDWTKTYDSKDNEYTLSGLNIKELSNGMEITGMAISENYGKRGFLIRTDENGNYKDSIYSKPFGAEILNIIEYKEDGYLAFGYQTGFIDSKGGEDLYFGHISYSNSSEVQYIYTDGFAGSDKVIKLVSDSDNFVSVSTITTETQGKDILITKFKFDSNFDKLADIDTFQRNYKIGNTSYNDEAGDIVVTPDGYMVTGTTTIGDETDVFFVYVNKEGKAVIGPKTIPISGNQTGNAIYATSDGGCVIIGKSGTTSNSMISLYKLDKNGNY